MITEQEYELLEKVDDFMKDLESLDRLVVSSDGIHGSGRYWFVMEESENKYFCTLEVKPYELEVTSNKCDGTRNYEMSPKLKDYLDQKLPLAKFSQDGNSFKWECDLEKILGP